MEKNNYNKVILERVGENKKEHMKKAFGALKVRDVSQTQWPSQLSQGAGPAKAPIAMILNLWEAAASSHLLHVYISLYFSFMLYYLITFPNMLAHETEAVALKKHPGRPTN